MTAAAVSAIRTGRRAWRRLHSPIAFALIVLAFFLPFATVSCGDAKTTFTGIQLVTHTVPQGGIVDDEGDKADIGDRVEDEDSTLAAVILVLAVLGLALGVRGVEKGPGWCASIGVVTTLALDSEGIGFSLGGPDIDLRIGYWLTLLLFLWAALLHGWRAMRRLKYE